MDYDNISFPEAVEKLAAQAGLEVPKDQLAPKTYANSKSKVHSLS